MFFTTYTDEEIKKYSENQDNDDSNKRTFINEFLSYDEGIVKCDFLIKEVETAMSNVESEIHCELPEVVVTAKSISKGVSSNSSDAINVKICKYIAKIRRMKLVLSFVEKGIDVLSQVFYWCINNIDDNMSKWLLCRVQILTLKLKKLSIRVKILIAKGFKEIIKGLSSIKGSWLETSLNATIQGLFTVVKTISISISAICQVIDTFLKGMPNLMSVEAEQICFFATKKSLTKTPCILLNTNKSCVDRISNTVKNAINALELGEKYAFKTLKQSAIIAGAAAGAASVFTDFEIPENICKMIKDFDNTTVIKKINKILADLLDSYPLPKYEELTPKTLGYLNWLMTGFIPAGHKSFGIPGYP